MKANKEAEYRLSVNLYDARIAGTAMGMGKENPFTERFTEASVAQKISPNALPTLTEDGDYRMLTGLLGLSEKQLTALTLHRFLSRINKKLPVSKETFCVPRNLLLGCIDILFTYTGQTIQVCPCCLDESDHDYLWMMREFLRTLSYSPLQTFLVERLPDDVVAQPKATSVEFLAHYFFAEWPVHLWMILERIHQGWGEEARADRSRERFLLRATVYCSLAR